MWKNLILALKRRALRNERRDLAAQLDSIYKARALCDHQEPIVRKRLLSIYLTEATLDVTDRQRRGW